MATVFRDETLKTGKPRELQDPLNHYIYHPLARRLARVLVPTGVSPNMVSIAGAGIVVLAAVLYTATPFTGAVVLAFALHLSWHVVDGADGDLARLTGRASPNGEMIDGMCDYFGHAALYILFAMLLDDRLGGWAWLLVAGAGISRAFQSVFAESQRRTYLWWAYGVPWVAKAPPEGDGIGQRLTRLYLRAAQAMGGPTETVSMVVAAAEPDLAERKRIALLTRDACRTTLPVQTALGANPRTVLLGLCVLAEHPQWFFAIELLPLNALLVFAIAQQARSCRKLLVLIGRGRH